MRNKVEICGIDTKNLKVLSEKEKIKLLSKIKSGDVCAREKLVNGNLRLVLSIVQKFIGRGESLDDLFQIGCIGLIKAIDNFDVSQNTRFSTYAVPMILGEIRRYLRDNNLVRVSRSMRDTAYKSLGVKEKLTYEKGCEPTLEEIAEELVTTKESVAIALDSILDPISLQDPIFPDGLSSDHIYMIDQIKDETDENSWINKLNLKENIRHLSMREKTILYERFFKGLTQMQVAKKMKISQAQVSRLETIAMGKINED